ncbi:MAG: LysE family translocator [Alphaproteobacteria bacterium]
MDLGLVLKGLVVGFVIAMPAGPIAMMCVHRSIEEGHLRGIATGIGAALADTVFGAVAVLGVGYVVAFIDSEQTLLRFAAGAVLCVLGVVTFLRRPRFGAFVEDHISLLSAFAGAFALTLANPITMLAFIAVFSALGVDQLIANRANAVALISGVLVGAATWWMALAVGSALFRDRFSEKGLAMVTRVSGLVIVGFGVAALVDGVIRLAVAGL